VNRVQDDDVVARDVDVLDVLRPVGKRLEGAREETANRGLSGEGRVLGRNLERRVVGVFFQNLVDISGVHNGDHLASFLFCQLLHLSPLL
jgi:hypothetical protein